MSKTESARILVRTAAYSHLYFYWSKSFTIIFSLSGIIFTLVIALVDLQLGWDFIRCLSLAMGSYIILFSIKIVIVYNAMNKILTGSSKYLPNHIKWISMSFIGLTISSCGWIINRIGKSPFLWGTPLVFISFSMAIYGLGLVWGHTMRNAAENGIWDEREISR